MEFTSEIYESVIRKILTDKSEITLIQFKNRYYEYIKDSRHSDKLITRGKNKGKIIEQTYTRNVLYTLEKFINYAGNILIKDVNVSIAEKYITDAFKRSKYTAALDYRILRSAFNKGKDLDHIIINPFTKFKLPKFQKNPPAYITIEQLEKILEHVPVKLKDVYRFAFYTGLRLGEITSLTWKNVNINDKIVQVGDSSFQTKSKKIRVIPINNEAAKILSDRVPKIFNKEKTVFCKTSKMPFTNEWLSKAFKRAVKKTDLDQSIHFHSLRHSFASNLVKNGVPLYHLKELLGHSSIAVTEIYSHLNIDSLRDAVNKFSNIAVSS